MTTDLLLARCTPGAAKLEGSALDARLAQQPAWEPDHGLGRLKVRSLSDFSQAPVVVVVSSFHVVVPLRRA